MLALSMAVRACRTTTISYWDMLCARAKSAKTLGDVLDNKFHCDDSGRVPVRMVVVVVGRSGLRCHGRKTVLLYLQVHSYE